MPHIEEIVDEDIDNMDYDPAEFDGINPFSTDTPVEAGVRLVPTSTLQSHQQNRQRPSSSLPQSPGALPSPQDLASMMGTISEGQPTQAMTGDVPEHVKSWAIIYPCYFDSQRTVSEGRRVPKDQATPNPLATSISAACRSMGLETATELTKSHPKDWANIGRVRVQTELPKRQLYSKISAFLQAHPTTEKLAFIDDYKRLAHFDSLNPLAVPKGKKIGSILPGFSPALSASKEIDSAMNMDNMGKMFGMG